MADPTDAAAGGAITTDEVTVRLTAEPGEIGPSCLTVILDTTWSGGPADGRPIIELRAVAERVLADVDLIAETSALLDRWAAESGVVERLVVDETSFWFYIRLRHWLWLEERVLWARILDVIVADHGPGRLVATADADPALLDVLPLVASRHGIAGVVETTQEETDAVAGPTGGSPRAPEEPAPAETDRSAMSAAAGADAGPVATDAVPPASRRRQARRLRPFLPVRLFRRARAARLRPPPPSPAELRRLELGARLERVRDHVTALAEDPRRRLLVVQEHARQVVETVDGPLLMNPYLDPIVDRLRGSALDPVVLDIRARAGRDDAWTRIGAGANPLHLPADALGPVANPGPAPAAGDAQGAVPSGPATLPASDPDTSLDDLAGSVEVAGIDLGPLLAAEVRNNAAAWLPTMAVHIDRIERFLRRVRPAGILLADEYHRQDWLTAAERAGIPVAAVQHGMIYAHHNGYIHDRRPPSLRLAARTYVFGQWERDLLVGASVYRPDEVVVGGSVRLDLLDVARSPDDSAALRGRLGIDPDEQLVVISGTWGGLYRRFHYPIALAALIDRDLPKVHFVVKLHPGEPDEGPYRSIIERVAAARGVVPPQVTTVSSIDLYQLLAAADAHLGIHSTVLTEAVVTRTPNLLATGVCGADLLGYLPARVAVGVTDGGSLLEALDRRTTHLDEADAEAFVAAHFEPGDATDRITRDLLGWLA